jgi:hypothetical protein
VQYYNNLVSQFNYGKYGKEKYIATQYGLLNVEINTLYQLNDFWIFTFEEFSDILARAPKTYNLNNLTRQRLLDSVEWLNYITNFRKANSRGNFISIDWYHFIHVKKSEILEVIDLEDISKWNDTYFLSFKNSKAYQKFLDEIF